MLPDEPRDAEREAHQRYLGMLSEAAGGACLWHELAGEYGD